MQFYCPESMDLITDKTWFILPLVLRGLGSVRPEEYLDPTPPVRSQQHGWSRQNSTPLAHASQPSPLTRSTTVVSTKRLVYLTLSNPPVPIEQLRLHRDNMPSPTDINTIDLQRGTPVTTSEVPPFLGCFFTICQDSNHARTDCVAKNCPLNPSSITVA